MIHKAGVVGHQLPNSLWFEWETMRRSSDKTDKWIKEEMPRECKNRDIQSGSKDRTEILIEKECCLKNQGVGYLRAPY